MERYIIGLKELGLKNNLILELLKLFTSEEIKDFFENNNNLFMSNIVLADIGLIFQDKEKVKRALASADDILFENEKYDIKTVIYNSNFYPENLKSIENPPAIIYYKGTHLVDDLTKSFACVGTRKPTSFSYNAINYLVPQWVNEGFTIVSGLALGVDSLSHASCVESGGKTIAVLANGLDQIAPKKNLKLADRILENGGTLVSEYPIKTKPEDFRYINRNRLIVGLARALVVFECQIKSGTMHSVNFAREQSKLIFCPSLGDKIYDNQSGLEFLINENIAIPIPSLRSYQIPILKLGFDIQKPVLNNSLLNELYIKSLLYFLDKNLYESLIKSFGFNIQTNIKSLNTEEIHLLTCELLKMNGVKTNEIINLLTEKLIEKNN